MAPKKKKITKKTSPKKSAPKAKVKSKPEEIGFAIEVDEQIANEIIVVLLIGAAILSTLSIFGLLGAVGGFIYVVGSTFFGVGMKIVPLFFLALAYQKIHHQKKKFNPTRYLGIFFLAFSLLGLIHLLVDINLAGEPAFIASYGGYLGFAASFVFRQAFSDVGAAVVLLIILAASTMISFEVSLQDLLKFLKGEKSPGEPSELEIIAPEGTKIKRAPMTTAPKKEQTKTIPLEKAKKNGKSTAPSGPVTVKIKTADDQARKNNPLSIRTPHVDKKTSYPLPELDLLEDTTGNITVDEAALNNSAEVIRDKLAKFGINVTMKEAHVGPTVIQYTLQPDDSVKLSKIKSLEADLALALAAKSIRIEAPIPGKALVGIEMPNSDRTIVHMRELLQSKTFDKAKSNLKIPLGKNAAGNIVIADIKKMPHLLIAGATGSGKSVCVNSILTSLLYQNTPNDLKMILVDPKRVELTGYNNIQHLLTPVITEPDKTVFALKWAVSEMTRRYRLFAEQGAKNIADFNKLYPDEHLPYIIIVIDELADLMMEAGKEAEALICRLAQMARAIGIHLILATQRPSVDVITGLIKANIPSRIAFTVASQTDSRTIIDVAGAEKLLGSGDMLFLPGNEGAFYRVQGVHVSNEEVKRVIDFLKVNTPVDLEQEEAIEEIVVDHPEVTIPGLKPTEDSGDKDEVYQQAVEVIRESGKASASLLQRRLSIGYARAARLLDTLEEDGLIGPAQGAKPREIYLDKIAGVSESDLADVVTTPEINDQEPVVMIDEIPDEPGEEEYQEAPDTPVGAISERDDDEDEDLDEEGEDKLAEMDLPPIETDEQKEDEGKGNETGGDMSFGDL